MADNTQFLVKCQNCAKEFLASRDSATYCGATCRQAASRFRRKLKKGAVLVPPVVARTLRQDVAAEKVPVIKEQLRQIAARESRDVTVPVTFSASQYVRLLEKSQNAGMSVEQWVRQLATLPIAPVFPPPGTGIGQTFNTGSSNSTVTWTPTLPSQQLKEPQKLSKLSAERELMRGTWDDPWMPVLAYEVDVEQKLEETEPVLGEDGYWHWIDENGEKCRSIDEAKP
jgi:hypothetical protein